MHGHETGNEADSCAKSFRRLAKSKRTSVSTSMSFAWRRARVRMCWSFPSFPSLVTNPDWRRCWRCSWLISALINFSWQVTGTACSSPLARPRRGQKVPKSACSASNRGWSAQATPSSSYTLTSYRSSPPVPSSLFSDTLISCWRLPFAMSHCRQANAEQAAASGAELYLASVAKSERGVTSAYSHYPTIAKTHSMTVLMANCVGPADTFIGAGRSAIWSSDGDLVSSADAFQEALVAYDTGTGKANVFSLA